MRDLFAAMGIAAQDRQFFFHLFPSFSFFSHLFPSFLRINSFSKKKNRVGSPIVLELELPQVLTLPTLFMTQWKDWSADRFSFPFFPSFPSLHFSHLFFHSNCKMRQISIDEWRSRAVKGQWWNIAWKEGRKENQNCCRESEFAWEIAWESRWGKRNCPIIHTFPLQFNPISWNFQARTTANFFFVFGNQVCFLLLSSSFPFPFLSPSKIKKPQSQSSLQILLWNHTICKVSPSFDSNNDSLSLSNSCHPPH